MSILATYREVRFDGWRTFELQESQLQIKGKYTFGAQFESVVPLAMLEPSITRVWTRSKLFHYAIIYCGISGIILMSGALTERGPDFALWNTWGLLLFASSLVMFLLGLAGGKRLEWVFLPSKAGVTAVSIARSGPDASEFDLFIEATLRQIKMAK